MNDIIFLIMAMLATQSDSYFFEKHNHFLKTGVLERTSKLQIIRCISSDKTSLFTIHFIGSHHYLEKPAQLFISCSTRIYAEHECRPPARSLQYSLQLQFACIKLRFLRPCCTQGIVHYGHSEFFYAS